MQGRDYQNPITKLSGRRQLSHLQTRTTHLEGQLRLSRLRWIQLTKSTAIRSAFDVLIVERVCGNEETGRAAGGQCFVPEISMEEWEQAK